MSDAVEEGRFADEQGKICSWRLKKLGKKKEQKNSQRKKIWVRINFQFRMIKKKDGHLTIVSQAKETKVRYFEQGKNYCLQPRYKFKL